MTIMNRRALMVSLAIIFCTIFTLGFVPSLPILALGEVLQGIPWVRLSGKMVRSGSELKRSILGQTQGISQALTITFAVCL